jgi:zinc D-Ala-D-Ala dipeptidase
VIARILKVIFFIIVVNILSIGLKIFTPKEVIHQDILPYILSESYIVDNQEESIESLTLVISSIEQDLIDQGLVNIQVIDSTIKVDLKYSGTDNFIGADVYLGLKRAYLQPDVAEKLAKAQKLLKDKFPEYSLIIFDAARPLRVQQTMWDTVKMPLNEKTKYLSNPKNGSIHNFGAAVDLSIVFLDSVQLDMGTPFDYFGELAHPSKEQQMLDKGLLTQEQINNRKLLREVMIQAGFFNISTEWWHFNSCTRDKAKELYAIIE